MSKRKSAGKPQQVWNPSKRVRAFLAAYAVTGSITSASEAAKISRFAHYRLLEKSAPYRAEFEKADRMAGDALEDEAIRRGREGLRKPLIYHGSLVRVPKNPDDPDSELVTVMEEVYSDNLLAKMIEGKKPEKYRQRVDAKHSGEVAVKKFDGTMEELLTLYRDLLKEEEHEQ